MLFLLLFAVYLFLIAVQSSPLKQHLSFQDWLVDEAKVDLHPSVQFLQTGKRGVIALNPLKKDVIVARIPLSSCISDATATKYLSGQFSEYGAFVKMAIFLHLISTKSNDHNASSALSYWYPFVNWMSVPNTPMLWSNDDLHYYLNGTSLKNEILNRIRLTNNIGIEMQQKGYNIHNIYNDQDHNQNIDDDDDNNNTKDMGQLLLWGMAMLQSRVHFVPQKRNETWETIKMLVPFADALNTGKTPNIDCYTNEESTHFICRTNGEILKGMQLTSRYGSSEKKGRGMYAINYGFIDESWMKLEEYVYILNDNVVSDIKSIDGLVKKGYSWNEIQNGIEEALETLLKGGVVISNEVEDGNDGNEDGEDEEEAEVVVHDGTLNNEVKIQMVDRQKKWQNAKDKEQLGRLIRNAEIETLNGLLDYVIASSK